ARHRLDAAGDGEIDLAAFDRARGVADRVETGGAEAVDGEAGDGIGKSGNQQGHARDVAVVLAGLIGAAKHDLVDRRPIDVGMALEKRLDRHGGKVIGAHLGERAAVAADRRAHRIAEEDVADFGHVYVRSPLAASCAGLTRASIFLRRRMDCQVKPGNDGIRAIHSTMISQAPIFTIRAELADIRHFGVTPYGERRVIDILGGRVEGPRLNGRILPGADWQIVRPDGVTDVRARYAIEADSGARILVSSDGLRHGPAEVIAALARGEPVDPARYYFRTVMRFETADPALAWLNRILALASGAREQFAVRLDVHEVL